MAIFIAQLFAFGVIVFLAWRYVVPPVRTMMAKQQDEVRRQLEESEAAQARLAEAERAHEAAVEKAKVEAAKIREDARADAQRIGEQLREQADAEVVRIKEHGQAQRQQQRQQVLRDLRTELGSAALTRTDEIVRGRMADPAEQSASVDRFLDELEALSTKGAS